jgi:hypothetical protein
LPFEFIFHSKDIEPGRYLNVEVKGYSVNGFQQSLHSCDAVICNAGFELASECLHLGRKILMKPLAGQVEQSSNALAIDQMQCGYVTDVIDEKSICYFLTTAKSAQIQYPDVPKLIAQWLSQYPKVPFQELVGQAWSEVGFQTEPLEEVKRPPILVA